MTYNLDIAGWMTEPELQNIERLAGNIPENGNMIEVGSFHGRSTWAWSKSVAEGVTIHCIDPWNNGEILPYGVRHLQGRIPPSPVRTSLEFFLANTRDCENIIFTIGLSGDVLPTLKHGHYDLVFLDGVHENPGFSDDLHKALPLVKSGGILCGHDFQPRFRHSIMANVTALAEALNQPVKLTQASTIWSIEVP